MSNRIRVLDGCGPDSANLQIGATAIAEARIAAHQTRANRENDFPAMRQSKANVPRFRGAVDDGIDKLTAAMAAGNETAIATFYSRYFPFLYRQSRRACRRDESFCLDVVQESCLRIIRSIRIVESEPASLAWLKMVVRCTAFDLLRRESRLRLREQIAVAGRDEIVESSSDESHEEQIAWLRGEIAVLDPELVRVIELRYQRNWTLQRIGQLMGLSTGAIDGRLRRALIHLRQRAKLQEEPHV
jgi:RNA polymerase sigma factor (sigma-70 family)